GIGLAAFYGAVGNGIEDLQARNDLASSNQLDGELAVGEFADDPGDGGGGPEQRIEVFGEARVKRQRTASPVACASAGTGAAVASRAAARRAKRRREIEVMSSGPGIGCILVLRLLFGADARHGAPAARSRRALRPCTPTRRQRAPLLGGIPRRRCSGRSAF